MRKNIATSYHLNSLKKGGGPYPELACQNHHLYITPGTKFTGHYYINGDSNFKRKKKSLSYEVKPRCLFLVKSFQFSGFITQSPQFPPGTSCGQHMPPTTLNFSSPEAEMIFPNCLFLYSHFVYLGLSLSILYPPLLSYMAQLCTLLFYLQQTSSTLPRNNHILPFSFLFIDSTQLQKHRFGLGVTA